ncbi:MAG TPA: DUF1800 domain-containing protein [Ktedonobacteraceae bacterium]|nr:DUF1800 domain-containing protein [Ktedonobacteraceae bacterium]
MDSYDWPTEPHNVPQGASLPAPAETPDELTMQAAILPPAGASVPPLGDQPTVAQKNLARRKFMGKPLVGLVGAGSAALIGGVALGAWLVHGGANGLLQGPVASNVQIGHLLRRAGFGGTADELRMYSNLGYQGAVERLLNYKQVDDSALEQRLRSLNIDLARPQDQQRWWLLRMAWTQRPLLEKMTLFWHGVLVSSFRKVGGPRVYQRMIVQNNFLRAHAFDTFDTILLGITSDPAMLFYLDLTKSTKKRPNENYARELMELFSIGLHYTQQDVSAGAAALTGWHARGLTSAYNPRDHTAQPLNFLGQTGNFDYKDVVRILASHPAAPWFICRKLFTFFAYENPSTEDLKPLVDAYVQSGHNMGAVMRALLLSPQFSSAKAYRSRLKSPVEFTVGAYRALGIQGDGTGLPAITTLMGQTLFDPPNVSGWPGDKVSASWLNSGTWMTRLNYIDILLARGTAGRAANPKPLIDLQGIVHANQLSSPEHFVDHFASFLLDGPLSADRRTQVLDYFTGSGNASGEQITLTNGQAYPLNRVRGALYLTMASPEYQLN